METRKIQEVTGGTFSVSLPRDWAQAEDIDKGDVVELYSPIEGVLVVQTLDCETDPAWDVTVELTETDTAQIQHSLRAAYTAGATEITLTTQSAFTNAHRRAATEVADVLAGATVTTATKREIVVQVLLDPEKTSVRQSVRQLSFVALSIYQGAMAALADDRSNVSFADRDDQADRLFAMTERSFTRALCRLYEVESLGETRPELFELWATARDLKQVANHAERISTIAQTFDKPPEDDHTDALQRLAAHTREVVECAVSGVVDEEGTDAVCEALERRKRVREEATEFDRRLFEDRTGDYRLRRILDRVRRVIEHGDSIAERGLRRVVRRNNAVTLD